jgi:hypothetical protein
MSWRGTFFNVSRALIAQGKPARIKKFSWWMLPSSAEVVAKSSQKSRRAGLRSRCDQIGVNQIGGDQIEMRSASGAKLKLSGPVLRKKLTGALVGRPCCQEEE